MKSVRTPGRLARVPNKPRTQHRSVRVDDPEWDDAEEATAAMGTDRAKVINQFLRWYLAALAQSCLSGRLLHLGPRARLSESSRED